MKIKKRNLVSLRKLRHFIESILYEEVDEDDDEDDDADDEALENGEE